MIHYFTASREFADIALALGFYISISGIVTFKNAHDLQATCGAAAAGAAADRDRRPLSCPGCRIGARPGEPAFVADTCRFLAQLRGEDPDALADATRANFHKLFLPRPWHEVPSPGSGTSSGVPRIGNDWGHATPPKPQNRRTRLPSALVWTEATRILIDTSPDFREQALAAGCTDLDAVIWTA